MVDGRMPKAETIRALERGIEVLRLLQAQPIASLHEIHVATAISKPSLLRILTTLERSNLVTRRLADGHYRLSGLGAGARTRDRHCRLVEAAAPVLYRLCEKVKWPSDLVVAAGDHMESRETSRPFSPFMIRPVQVPDTRAVVGARIGWLMTAVGRAYLAACPDAEREKILQRLRRTGKPWDRLAHDAKRLDQILAETRRRGFGTRDPGFVGGVYDGPPQDDQLSAIAVALVDGERVHGVINIFWIRNAFTVEQFAKKHLADLQAAAHEIVLSLRRPV
jgi:IclR family mhp operon transcriptional activator